MKRTPTATAIALTLFLAGLGIGQARADTVVQVPLPGLLTGRSVTTLTGGQIVPFTLPTDGGGLQNAFATKAVATMQGQPVANALPDDGIFPADARHPEVVLHFSNDAEATSPQTVLIAPSGSFQFAMPAATYSKVFLFFNGAAGGTTIDVTLTYADTMETKNATVPDYYADIPVDDPVIFNLAADLAKYDLNTMINEANHHNITGVELAPLADKMLTGIEVVRGAEGNLVFWGATAIATSELPGSGGTGAGGGAGAGGTSGASGASGGGGTAGAGGSGVQSAGAAGSSATAGAANGGAAGTSVSAGGNAPLAPATAESDPGCGCRLGASPSTRWLWLAVGAFAALWLARRR